MAYLLVTIIEAAEQVYYPSLESMYVSFGVIGFLVLHANFWYIFHFCVTTRKSGRDTAGR